MRSLRGALFAMGTAAGMAAAGGLAVIGCGDDTSATQDSGQDVTGDTSPDGGEDVVQQDNTTDTAETSMMAEGGDATDGSTADVADAADAADADALPPSTLAANFANQETRALCQNWLGCCPGGLSAYDLQKCVGDNINYGWEGSLSSNLNIYQRNNLAFDSAKAAQCLSALQAMPCGTENAAQWSAVTQACELVVTGTIPIGQSGCISSWECTTNSYCSATDGGTGTCVALSAQGGPCNTVIQSSNNPIPDEMCSYLGSSNNGLYCDLIDPTTSANYGTCQPLLAAGASCVNATTNYGDDQACPTTGALCGDNGLCGGGASYPYTPFCNNFISDAGGGG